MATQTTFGVSGQPDSWESPCASMLIVRSTREATPTGASSLCVSGAEVSLDTSRAAKKIKHDAHQLAPDPTGLLKPGRTVWWDGYEYIFYS